jgi:hypothetical protein
MFCPQCPHRFTLGRFVAKKILKLIIQGVPKVLEAFVFKISSKSLGAQKKNYRQIKAEILKFMWVCGKSKFE